MGVLVVNGVVVDMTPPKVYFTEEDLQSKDFKELKEIGATFDVTDRSKQKLIKEILAAQG